MWTFDLSCKQNSCSADFTLNDSRFTTVIQVLDASGGQYLLFNGSMHWELRPKPVMDYLAETGPTDLQDT
ncbi:hypothetical protein RRF57_006916 [Xylaria bambusicola]|uniref:Uncharacterized protein n=1 Tax=Xylaria bambusicola TaxID=326684 RepID=A0AAN7UR41_9PEZI